MAPDPRPDGWLKYTHHRQAKIFEWDEGITLKRTAEPGGDSQYNPHLYATDESIQEIEFLSVTMGVVIRETHHRVTKYFRRENEIVGACSGQYTEYIFVECTSGFFHGRPICVAELRRLGVDI